MSEPTSPQLITLIITVLNEADSLDDWFRSLAAQRRTPDELVISDGGSEDGTIAIINEWASRLPFPVRVLNAPGANISEGRNIAIEAASHEWVAVTDGGTVLDSGWLNELAGSSNGVDVVSGFYYPAGSTPFERFLATMISFREDEVRPEHFLPSSRSLMLRKQAWSLVGGYPTWLDYCEDLVFDLRLKEAGLQFAFAPAALVSWSARSSVRSFAKQYYRYARGDGKAGLWARRHAVRYAAYSAGAVSLVSAIALQFPAILLVVALGAAAFNGRYLRRVLLGGSALGAARFAWLLAVIPIGTVGDLAKMAGYPAGRRWRKANRPPEWRGGVS